MTTWEYRVESIQGGPGIHEVWIRLLNTAGSEGWELVTERVHDVDDGSMTNFAATFKRPVDEE